MHRLRGLATVCARFLDKISGGKLKPNTVTILSLLLHLPVGWLIISGQPVYAGIALVIFASLDAVDGALARLQNSTSDFGVWLDASSDRLKEIIVFSALAYYLAAKGQDTHLIALCVAALGLSLLISYVKAKGEAILAIKSRKLTSAQLNRLLKGGLLSYEWRVLLVALILISQQFEVGLIVLAAGTFLTLLQRSLKIKKELSK